GHSPICKTTRHTRAVGFLSCAGAPQKQNPPGVLGGFLAGGAPPWARRLVKRSGGLNVRRLLSLGALGHFELDLLAFLERLEALHVDRREVREQVFAAVVRGDEPIALRVVEPLDGSGCHTACSLQVVVEVRLADRKS